MHNRLWCGQQSYLLEAVASVIHPVMRPEGLREMNEGPKKAERQLGSLYVP